MSIMGNKNYLHWAWIILGVCFFNLFMSYSVRLGYGVVLPEMIGDLNLGRTAGGTIYNAYLFTYIILTPFAGYFTDKFGGRKVITVCCVFLCIGVVLMGTAGNLLTASLFFGIAGMGATGMWTSVITLVQRWFAFHRRGLALGILSTGYGLGFAAMGVVFPWIVRNYNWRLSWYLLGGMAFVMIFANCFLLKSDPEASGYQPWGNGSVGEKSKSAVENSGAPVRLIDIFKNRNFWIIGLSYFAISYAIYGTMTFMVDYARYQLGLSLEKSSFLATIHGFGQIAGVLIILPLSDYVGRKKTIIISNTMIALSLAGILYSGSAWYLLYMCIGWAAIFQGATFPVYGACAGDYFPREWMGTVIGAWTPFYGLGAIMTHWISGITRDATGIYDYAFSIDIIMAVAALILISCVRRSSERRD